LNAEKDDNISLLPPLTTDEENKLESKMVWVFGSPRSGTSWLVQRLLKHPANIIWNEPLIGYHLGALVETKDFEKGYRFSRAFDNEGKREEYFFCHVQHKSNWLPALRKLILARTFSHSQSLTKNVVIKEPTGSNGADIISQCLPNSKFIFIIRDGRDIIESRLDMHGSDSWAKLPPLQGPDERSEMIQRYSELWNTFTKNTRRAFTHHNPKLRVLVKYENLRNNTFKELKRIYKFLKINISDENLNKNIEQYDFNNIPSSKKGLGKFDRKATPGSWKESFNQEEQDLLNSIMGKLLVQFGYKI